MTTTWARLTTVVTKWFTLAKTIRMKGMFFDDLLYFNVDHTQMEVDTILIQLPFCVCYVKGLWISDCFRLVDQDDNKFRTVTAICQLWDGQWNLNGSLHSAVCASKIEDIIRTSLVRMPNLIILFQASDVKRSRMKCNMPDWLKWFQMINGIEGTTRNLTKGKNFRSHNLFLKRTVYRYKSCSMIGSQTCTGHGRFSNSYLDVGYKTECAWNRSNRSTVVYYKTIDNLVPSSFDTCVES